MAEDRIHRAISDDGTEIAGRVHGQGPPLVLVHGALEDGDTCWVSLLPFLSERFTCYAMSLRGRGLSGRSPDLSLERSVQDVVTFADSVGDHVGLVGESGGGFLALGATARTDAVSAVAVYEPIVFEARPPQDAARFADTVDRVADDATAGRLTAAVRTFAALVANDDELAVLAEDPEVVEALAPNVPVQLEEFAQLMEHQEDPEAFSPTAPSVLASISVPALVLHGSETVMRTWIRNGAHHVAQHVADARIGEIAGAGHFGPAFHPEAVAGQLVRFFEPVLQPA